MPSVDLDSWTHLWSSLPPEELAVISTLSPSDVSQWAQTRIKEYKKRIHDLKRHIVTFRGLCNLDLPISRLPNEILIRIFSDPSFTLAEIVIGSVCRRWRSALLATHHFWAEILSDREWRLNSKSRKQLFRTLISRSGGLPLNLVIKDAFDVAQNVELSAHYGRLTRLKVHFERSGDKWAFQKAAYVGMPNLFAFQVSYDKDLGSTEALILEEQQFPALRVYAVTGTPFASCSIVNSLENLQLTNVGITLEILINVLEKCPNLRVLYLSRVLMDDLRLDGPVPQGTIVLPNLRTLMLFSQPHDRHIPHLLALFKSIPSDAFVSIDFKSSTPVPELYFPNLPGIFVGPHIDRLYIEYPDRGMWCPVARGYVRNEERLRLRIALCLKKHMLHPLNPFLQVPISTLVINRAWHRVSKESTSLLRLLHSLRRLELSHTCEKSYKHTLAMEFLDCHASIADELTLVWVVGVERGRLALGRASAELEGLVDLLRRHCDSGKPHLGVLELYAVRLGADEVWNPFEDQIEEYCDPLFCAQAAQHVLSKLQEFVNTVVFQS